MKTMIKNMSKRIEKDSTSHDCDQVSLSSNSGCNVSLNIKD